MSLRIAILLSGRHGRGSNMQAIAAACASGQIDGTVALVIGNYADSPALTRAAEMDIPTLSVSSRQDESIYAESLLSALNDAKVDLICLAGYMRKVPDSVVTAYKGRVMNIHAALLPAFGGKGMYGIHAHQAVLDYGAKVSGCTVHFVDENYDTGPVIWQSVVPVEEDDSAETLAARVLTAEHDAYPRAVALFAEGRLTLEGRRVRISEPLPLVPCSLPC
ncbi:MAG: phosphoribosylglycinamide formyltransferase [Janthinobacterium lividum]